MKSIIIFISLIQITLFIISCSTKPHDQFNDLKPQVVHKINSLSNYEETEYYYVFFESKKNKYGEYIYSSERAIPKILHAVKNKYCPKIDWSSIKNKQKT